MLVSQPLAAQPGVNDYEHAIGLRTSWSGLTENIAEPAQWIDGTHRFVYRKTVPGGFQFVVMDAQTQVKQPAFDHDRIAAALGTATGKVYSGLHLPFTEPFASVEIIDGGRALNAEFDEAAWQCSLTDYVCSRLPPHRGHQPRGFETVRDPKIPADNSPKKSPDGKWLAFVQNWNLAMRDSSGGETILLSTDGSQGEFYDPESISWSPDSRKLAAYRVRPGFPREVTRVISSPADQVQPKLAVQLYPKPGDAVDIDRPVIFHIDGKTQLQVPFDQFPNPFTMSPLTWRKDSGSVTFEYDQRGHQLYSLFEINADTGIARAVATDRSTTFVNTWRRFAHDVGGMGREIIWMSERDGWNHLYLYDGRTGRVKNQITKGEWVVREVVKVDDEKRQIWFAANGMRKNEDPYFQHYYRIDFDGSHLTPITTASAYHDVAFSSDMNFYVDTYSRIDMPNVAELHRASDGALLAEVERGDITKLVAAGFKAPEVFVAKGRDGKTDIWGIIVRPQNFDPAKIIRSSRIFTPDRIPRSCRKPSGRSDRTPAATKSWACSPWRTWGSSWCKSTAWARSTVPRLFTTWPGRTWETPGFPTAFSGTRQRPANIRTMTSAASESTALQRAAKTP